MRAETGQTRSDVASADEPNDSELVHRVQQGEKEAFGPLVHRHERRVYWIVQGILQNHADSEGILQETFLKALQHIQDFRGEAQFSTWLIQIALNEARMRRKRYRAGLYDSLDQNAKEGAEFMPRELTDWRLTPEEKLAEEELVTLLHRAVRALPEKYREVFLLRDVQELSNEEAAKTLGISLPAAKTRILRARLMVREFLAPHFKMRWHNRLLDRVKRPGRFA